MPAVVVNTGINTHFSAFVILMAAYTIRGIAGFGSGLIAIPLLALMLPLSVTVPFVGFLDYSAALAHGFKLRSEIRWQQILPLLPFTLLGIFLALYLFNTLDAQLLKKFLGGFIISYALYTLLTIKPHTNSSYLWAIPSGIFDGLISTLFGTGGPFYVVYLKLRQLRKSQFRATIVMIFLVDGGARMTAYAVNGLFTPQVLWLVLTLLPVLFAGLYAGHHLHIKINQQRFNLVINLLLIVSGIMLIIKSVAQ
ncbi:MAG: sulfite exporter TauE/SafE family protein [Gammaproteobacteria bacterium]|nr:sulfite exporter TauE/SafE family protein [Gammaproteobacteria bacterium]